MQGSAIEKIRAEIDKNRGILYSSEMEKYFLSLLSEVVSPHFNKFMQNLKGDSSLKYFNIKKSGNIKNKNNHSLFKKTIILSTYLLTNNLIK